MRVEQILENADRKKRLRRLALTILIGVVILHVIAGIVAGAFIVAKYFAPAPATFEVKRDLRIEAQQREHAMNMSAFDSMTPKPTFNDKIQSQRPAPMALPDLPKVPMDQMLPLDPSEIVSDQVTSLVGVAGTGSGAGGGGTGSGGTGASGMSFFGIQDTARSVVIVVDTSNSMFERSRQGQLYRFNFQTIKDQATQLIDGLGINTRFNVVVYEGGALAFSDSNLPATDQNKAAAREWIQSLDEDPSSSISRRKGNGPRLMEGGGTRLDTAMRQTFQFQPEVVYIITDGEINRSGGSTPEPEPDRGRREERDSSEISEREMLAIIADLQKTLPAEARIHTILYETAVARPEEVSTIRAIARRNGGKFRQVQAEAR